MPGFWNVFRSFLSEGLGRWWTLFQEWFPPSLWRALDADGLSSRSGFLQAFLWLPPPPWGGGEAQWRASQRGQWRASSLGSSVESFAERSPLPPLASKAPDGPTPHSHTTPYSSAVTHCRELACLLVGWPFTPPSKMQDPAKQRIAQT